MHQIFDTDFNCKTFHIILNFIFHIFNFFPVMNIISISTGFAHDILDVRCPDRTYLMLKCVFIYPLHFIWELSSSGDVMGPKATLRRISKFINVVYPWNFTRYFLILHNTSKNAQKFSWNLSSGKLQIKASIPLCDHRVQSERQCSVGSMYYVIEVLMNVWAHLITIFICFRLAKLVKTFCKQPVGQKEKWLLEKRHSNAFFYTWCA